MTALLDRAPAEEQTAPVAGFDAGVSLLALWLAALLLIPDRFTLPRGADLAVRPHHAVLVALAVVVVRRWVKGTPIRLGRAVVILVLPLVAAVSLLQNLPSLGSDDTDAGLRAFGEVSTLALIVLLTAAVAPGRRQRRALVGVIVALLVVNAGLGFWEASTGNRALDGLDETIPVLGVETFSSTGERAADPFAKDEEAFQYRLGTLRVAGSSRHAIEFSVVMCFGVVLALGLAARAGPGRGSALVAATAMAAALPLALARTGVIGVVVAGLVAVAVARRRSRALVAGAVLAVVLIGIAATVRPGSTAAMASVIGMTGNDSSIAARTGDYDEVDRAIGTAPWTGQGIGQWESYRTGFGYQLLFDNQYLLSAEETGVLGLAAFVAVLVTAAATALAWARRADDERPLALAVLAAVIAFAVMSGTFDSLYFSQAASLFMFFFGLACAAMLPRDAST